MRVVKILFRLAATVWIFLFMLYLLSIFPSEASVPQHGYKIKTKTPISEPTNTPEPTGTLVSTDTPEPTKTPEAKWTLAPTATPTERPHDCHIDGDGICPGEETPPPAIIFYTSTPLPPKPTPVGTSTDLLTLAPTETSMAQVACPCCCCAQVGVGSEDVDYSEAILEFKPIAYILVGIFGANTLLRTYGTFRKD